MRASIAHVVATALLVALPALASVQAAPAQGPANTPPPPPPPSVKVGDQAPDFDLEWLAPAGTGTENPPKFERKRVKLSDFKGKQNVVVAFFPAAFSPGCTNEMKQYQTNHGTFTAANTTVLGVSVDSAWSNKAFREQLGVAFPILSDWKREAAKAYGLYDENAGIARRATFVVDKTGVVRKVDVNREALDPSGVVGMCKTLATQ